MARPFEKISDINDTKELWKVAVRVHHKWLVLSNNKQHGEMIVVDQLGNDIHVVVPSTFMEVFGEKLIVGHTYTIANFKVQQNDLVFKPSKHSYIVKFTGGTSVSDVDKHEIPPKPANFTSFSDIMTGQFRKDLLLGMVDTIGFSQPQSGGKKQQVNFVLRDIGNNTINCTLWESYASQFIKFNQDRVNVVGPTVVMLQYAKVKEEGKYPLAVTNTYNVTKMYINTDMPCIKDFLERIPKDALLNVSAQLSSQSQLYSQHSENSQQSPTQKLLSKSVVLSLEEIIKLRDITFCATVTTIKKLIASPFGWYYQACHQCPKVTRGNKPLFLCEAGHSTEAEIFRYKIEVEVVHAGKCCKFVLWDRECVQLLGLSAAQMRETMIKAGIHDPLEFPLALDVLLNLEVAFKVKWQPRWESCSVVMIVMEEPFVKQLKAPWEKNQVITSDATLTPQILQIKESVDEVNYGGADATDIVTDLEITSKHNPEPVTPTAKRSTPDGSSESTTLISLGDGELSSTKLKKIIKTEKTK